MIFITQMTSDELRVIHDAIKHAEQAIEHAEQCLSLAREMVGMKIDKIAEENLPRQDEVEILRKKPRPKKEPEIK